MQRSSRSRVVLATTLLVTTVPAACGRRHGPPPEPARSVVVPRHFDQVCDAPRGPTPAVRIDELFDTLGLGRRLAEVGVRPLPLAPPWPLFEFITRYAADGSVAASGAWDATVDTEVATALERELTARIRSLPGLLAPTGFRSQVVYARRISFEVRSPVVCMPHMVHRPGERALGLPEDVGTWGGRARVPEGDASTAVVRIHVAADGTVSRVEDLEGHASALARAHEVIARLRFEPALENGVPVEGSLVQTFRFRTRG